MARTLNMPGLLRTPELRIGTKIINASTKIRLAGCRAPTA